MYRLVSAALIQSTAFAFSSQVIDESVKFNNADEGIIVSIGSNAMNYMKTKYLPALYSKVSNISLPEFEFSDGPLSGKVRA